MLLDALGGPAAQAAMKAIAANPGAYLGKNFDSAKAAGALVSALLVESAKNQDVSVAFGQAGALKLLNAALQVVADKPGLFIKTGDKPDAVASLLTDLAASLATQLKTPVLNLIGDQQVDGSALATGIAAAAIEVFGRRADALIGGQGDPWHDVARKAAAAVLGNLATAINAPAGTALKQALSQDKLVELGRIVIEGIAANPGMTGASDAKAREIISAVATAIDAATKDKKQFLLTADDWLDVARSMVKEGAAVPGLIAGKDAGLQAVVTALANVIAGDKNSVMAGADIKTVIQTLLTEVVSHPAMLAGLKDDVQRVTLAVAKAMAADSNLLLSGPDWAEILKAALSEASANPARLFGLNYNDGNQALAADIIGLVLKSIPTLPAAGGTTGLILKGDVLREATSMGLVALGALALVLAQRLARDGAILAVVMRRPRRAGDRQPFRQQPVGVQAVERGQQHPPRQVSGGAEQQQLGDGLAHAWVSGGCGDRLQAGARPTQHQRPNQPRLRGGGGAASASRNSSVASCTACCLPKDAGESAMKARACGSSRGSTLPSAITITGSHSLPMKSMSCSITQKV